ncbi:ATP-binding protein [Microcoleus sp. FACHB-SPT15]|uniref:ATP-binding protein n=1 Tax=Microcoleus sp. FACHB-SPT15 TaxID=2692830 RepID=UPI0017875207|nr:ATP-binding protein [Microcoleus sp. FACHB-SPT15]MBD1808115.1 ATP-binding protein [Microcoleus sp. FACHB-SPT15]
MTNSNSAPSLLVGKGAVELASYRDPLISSYRGNPLIEALPPILSEEEAMTLLGHYPSYDQNERTLPNHLRFHLVRNALKFVEPLPIHLDLEQRFSCMIRTGYEARNPLTPEFRRDFQKRLNALDFDGLPQNYLRSTATGFTIIGISGVGKTTAVEAILSIYPQVIVHSHYGDRDFTLMQIVWLKLDCPFDGSIKGLCLNFFQAVDDLLGTNYSKNYGRGRFTVDQLIPYIARVASLHCIGALVIDEIQHLNEAKSGGSKKMLNFFVQLVNTIGIPVVLVGTYKAISILSGEFRQTRRASGQGDLVWDRMEQDDVWDLFVESLWRYQYISKPCPLKPELSQVLYDVTQGITDFAVKVYMLAQVRAIATGKESVTESIIRSVAKDSLRLAQPILSALKTGDIKVLHSVEDVHPIDIIAFLKEAQKTTKIVGHLGSSPTIQKSLEDSEEEVEVHLQNPAPDSPTTEAGCNSIDVTSQPEIKKRQKKPRKNALQKEGLMKVVAFGEEREIAAYQALKQEGYIRSATEYLPEEVVR